jgi:hypothetical protein
VNVNLLIDALVRQTTVLIAQLATTAGARAPLAHTANRVFLDLTRELKQQGLGNKVISDMFGLTLRAYHGKVARLSESGTERGRSLWEALLAFVQEKGSVSRLAIFERFSGDEETVVRGVLRDLVDTGLLYRSGRGDWATYRAATDDDAPTAGNRAEHLAHLVWVVVHRYGPVSLGEIAEHVPTEPAVLDEALRSLVADRRVVVTDRDGGVTYSTDGCVVPLGSAVGWEAAVFDHYQAVVTALCTKLRIGRARAVPGEWIGGSTYSVNVWSGHPLEEEVLGLLQRTRDQVTALRGRVETYNERHSRPANGDKRVIFYVGQTVLGLEEEGSDE